MAAGAYDGSTSNGSGTVTTGNDILNDGRSAVPENPPVDRSEGALKHVISMSVEWTRDKQSLLEQLLAKYASDSTVMRYAKIAMHLEDKTVRDVALRCRWMTEKENGMQRKDNVNSSRRQKDKREKNSDKQGKPSSNAVNDANGLPYAQFSTSVDNEDDISIRDWCTICLNTDIGGVEGQLLEQNAQFLEQISANIPDFKVHENLALFWQTRRNFTALMNNVDNVPEMKRMRPLSVKINDELFNSIRFQLSMPIGF